MSEILVVDDERSMREFLEILLSKEGWRVRTAGGMADAIGQIRELQPDLVITDLKMKGGSGIDLLKEIKTQFLGVEVIVITAFATTETAILALNMGAYDYVTKPFQVDEIKVVVQRALERQRLLKENLRMRAELTGRYEFGGLIGRSPRMQEIYRLIELAAPTRSNVLITGESGTGKELVARAIHMRSTRKDAAFVPIDCASIPEQLLESELFGSAKGAFTGATVDRPGLFELADGGTVFLDEIGEIPQSVQVKLLRAIQERSIRRLGEGKDRSVDVRLLTATNRNIEEEVQAGRFREDLFFRINVIRIHLPPLRERMEDVPELVRSFLEKLAAQEGRQVPVVIQEALDVLMAHDFPGNVRELQNLVEQAVALSEGRSIIGPELFDKQASADKRNVEGMPLELPKEGMNLEALLSSIERKALEQALKRSGGVKTEAAKLLGISFRSMRYRLIKHKMD